MNDKTQHQQAQELIDWTRTNGDPGWATHKSVIGLFSVIRELQDRVAALESKETGRESVFQTSENLYSKQSESEDKV